MASAGRYTSAIGNQWVVEVNHFDLFLSGEIGPFDVLLLGEKVDQRRPCLIDGSNARLTVAHPALIRRSNDLKIPGMDEGWGSERPYDAPPQTGMDPDNGPSDLLGVRPHFSCGPGRGEYLRGTAISSRSV